MGNYQTIKLQKILDTDSCFKTQVHPYPAAIRVFEKTLKCSASMIRKNHALIQWAAMNQNNLLESNLQTDDRKS